MLDDPRAAGGRGDCSDPLVLQKFVDGELPGPEAELIAHHMESCRDCSGALAELKALGLFVQGRLGAEDEGEDEASHRILQAVGRRLPGAALPVQPPVSARWRRPVWIGAAAALLLVVLLSLPFSGRIDASAERILAESGAREHAWVYQPNKVLHWDVHTISTGLHDLPNGTERTVFWRRNGDSTFDEISRRYGADGRTLWAYWRQPDGSSISYRTAAGRRLEISPSTAALREALSTLDSDLRPALERFLTRRERIRSIGLESRQFADWLERSPGASGVESTSVQRVRSPEWGDVYRVTAVTAYAQRQDRLVRAIHEHDIEARGFRRVRLKTTLTYSDGSTGVHDSRWTEFRESSEAEFESQVPRDLLQQGLPAIELTPLQLARRERREMDGVRGGAR
ncbi:MAG TPA: zf-HC2 domain-containing protein [Vicinamibacterales bacterium]|nr:zf-HC2 domain-containing protein [Vicinamibacterales bacterium]